MGWRRTVGSAALRALGRVYRTLRPRGGLPPLRDLRPREVLAFSPLRIGDAVATEPALRALKAAYPDARLTLALRPAVAELGAAFEAPDRTVAASSARELRAALPARPDLAVVFGFRFGTTWAARRTGAGRTLGYDDGGRGFLLTDTVPAPAWVNRPVWEYRGLEPRPQARFWLDLLAGAGLPVPADAVPRLRLPEAARARAEALLREAGLREGDRLVVLHPGAESAKLWDPARWREVARALAASPATRLAVAGAVADRHHVAPLLQAVPGALDLSGRTSLVEYAAILARAALLVSLDTGATHLAAAVGTSVVALFGPGDPRIWAPAGAGLAVLQGINPDCYGCKRPACFRERHFCMEAIGSDAVLGASRAALDAAAP
ncbi:MAG: glycosyltransferase family 9 protein [Planctomycetales bacterium]|nr:glycosyltransferase family 9 protein [Planctomycetales bacterium]